MGGMANVPGTKMIVPCSVCEFYTLKRRSQNRLGVRVQPLKDCGSREGPIGLGIEVDCRSWEEGVVATGRRIGVGKDFDAIEFNRTFSDPSAQQQPRPPVIMDELDSLVTRPLRRSAAGKRYECASASVSRSTN